MKLIHLSDLHFGKRFNEFSLIEDQKYIIERIYKIIDDEKPQGVIIAGDVYDRSVPSTEAVELFDEFLVKLCSMGLSVYIASGNHDSAERLSFGNRLLAASKVYLSSAYKGDIKPVVATDDYGEFNIYLLPFIKPALIRAVYDDAEISSYTDAVKFAIEKMNVDYSRRNIIVAHQFVTGATTCESEIFAVGGADNVDATVFENFDYTALGHIHGPQNIGSEKIRYCGTPLKYSFSEENHKKSVTVVELKEKGDLTVKTVPLTPYSDVVTLKGTYDELMCKDFYEGKSYPNDYVRIILTDEDEVPNALNNLRIVYPKIAEMRYDNTRSRSNGVLDADEKIKNKSEFEIFSEFYELQNGTPLGDEARKFVENIIEEIKEGQR